MAMGVSLGSGWYLFEPSVRFLTSRSFAFTVYTNVSDLHITSSEYLR